VTLRRVTILELIQ